MNWFEIEQQQRDFKEAVSTLILATALSALAYIGKGAAFTFGGWLTLKLAGAL